MAEPQSVGFEDTLAVARHMGKQAGRGAEHECDLSGEWADRPGGPQVYQSILEVAGATVPDGEDWFSELLDAYEEAYNATARIGLYGAHSISLEYENISLGGFAYTNWVLFVDSRLFYLGQDSKFVTRVLGRDFAEFLREAFERADLHVQGPGRELDDEQRAVLRASLAAGIVRALDDLYADRGEDFFEALEELEAWSLSAD